MPDSTAQDDAAITPRPASTGPPPPPPQAAGAPAREEGGGVSAPGLLIRTLTELGAAGGEAPRANEQFNALVRAASQHCRRIVDAGRVRIWVARRGGRRLVAREAAEEGREVAEYRLAGGEGLPGWAMTNARGLRLAPGEVPPGLRGAVEPFRSALVVPLHRRGEAFGAIECLDKNGGGAFTDEDVEHLEHAAEPVAFALDNALLYQEAERRALEREVLLEATRTLSESLDLDEVLEAILRSLRQVVSYEAAAVYLVNRRTLALEMVSEVGYPEGSDDAFGLQVGQGIVGWVAKTGEPVIVADVTRDGRYVAARPGTRSELAAPLQIKGRTIGVFNLEHDVEDAYHEGHLDLLRAFATQAAVALERARLTRELLDRRRIEKELAIAREIQLSFLPKQAPRVPRFDLAGSARAHDEVGGDYYDFIDVSQHRLGLAIADVSGKGIPAALIMAGLRMALLAAIRSDLAIRAVFRKVNQLLFESTERHRFVTLFYGVLDWNTGHVTFANAGHNPPILRRADGTLQHLVEGGVALGVLPDALYDDRPVRLRPGDVLVMFTDGVTEIESPEGEQFGSHRVEELLHRLHARTAAEIVEGIESAVLAWAGSRGQNDDLTLMVIRALPAEAS